MKEVIKNKFPKWCLSNKKFNMCLTDDLDSLSSCILLNKIKGYEITNFYSFNTLYDMENKTNTEKLIGVDMDLAKYSCWGNHVTGINNDKSANLNVIENIGINNYYSKYCGSVLLQIISFYDVDISKLSDEAKMVLLCVDSTYLMYNFNVANCKKWLVDILELPELFKLCKEHTREDFKELQIKYKLKSKIIVNENGYLQTNINLQELSTLFNVSFFMPKNRFIENLSLKDVGINTSQYPNFIKKLNNEGKEVFSQAITNKNYIKLSYEI